MSYTIGLDLGGTNIKGGIIDGQANIIARHAVPTARDNGPEEVMDRMAQLAQEVCQIAGVDYDSIGGIGVGTPGPIDTRGVVLHAPNLPGWVNIDLTAGLSRRTGKQVAVVNDANAAAYGEFTAGAGKDPAITHLIMLTLGTGIGGGIVLGRELYIGARNAGAELGHTIVETGGRLCGCGQRGCVEQYASATAIAREAAAARTENPVTKIPDEPTTEDVFKAAADGDEIAQQVIEEAIRYLAAACVTFVRALDPQIIVLGGGVVAAGDALIERVERSFLEQTWHLREEDVRIAAAELGNDAGFLGAAAMATDPRFAAKR